jgi:hypothetical protein
MKIVPWCPPHIPHLETQIRSPTIFRPDHSDLRCNVCCFVAAGYAKHPYMTSVRAYLRCAARSAQSLPAVRFSTAFLHNARAVDFDDIGQRVLHLAARLLSACAAYGSSLRGGFRSHSNARDRAVSAVEGRYPRRRKGRWPVSTLPIEGMTVEPAPACIGVYG